MSKSKITLVLCYKIQNLLDLSAIERSCAVKSIGFSVARTISDLSRLTRPGETLIICDLSTLTTDDIQSLAKVSRDLIAKTFGFFPHVSQEIRSTARKQGIDYIVPRSAFRAKLESILG